MKTYVITTLAMNQTLFFEKMGAKLAAAGHKVYFLPFHERSHLYLREKGLDSINPFEELKALENQNLTSTQIREEFEHLAREFKLPNSQLIFAHEMSAFEISDPNFFYLKSLGYLRALKKFFGPLKGQDVVIVQELGGFLSLILTYYATLASNFKHFFFEPAFFKGRCFILENQLETLDLKSLSSQVEPDLKKYLEDTITNQKIVIPDKDKKHYWGLFRKLFQVYNFKRFYQKATDKYLNNIREEFSHIEMYTWRHAKMLFKKASFSEHYVKDIPKKFIYYPLHVPMDVALTLRTPHCWDQYALIDYISRVIPRDYVLVIKEHPAMVGVIEHYRTKDILNRNKNLVMLDPGINNFEVLKRADLIVTVNSKSGAEALMLGKKVIVMGDAFYRNCPLVKKLVDQGTLEKEIAASLSASGPSQDQIFSYFQTVWNASFPGEIYGLEDKNVQGFADAVLEKSR